MPGRPRTPGCRSTVGLLFCPCRAGEPLHSSPAEPSDRQARSGQDSDALGPLVCVAGVGVGALLCKLLKVKAARKHPGSTFQFRFCGNHTVTKLSAPAPPWKAGALPTSIQKVGATKGLSELLFTLSGSVCPRHYSPFHCRVAVWRLGYGLDTGRL